MFLSRTICLCLLFAAGWPSAACGQQPEESTAGLGVISVCDVLRNPVLYNGKRIAVRGFFALPSAEPWLGGDCPTNLITEGFVWPNYISLTGPDLDAVRAPFYSTTKSRINHAADLRVWVTYVGVLQTRADMTLAVEMGADGKAQPNGFGHLKAAPAQLLVQSSTDIATTPLPLVSVANQPDPETVSVCDVLRDPFRYNGKLVAVRGYLFDTTEGEWLTEDCPEHLVTFGKEWSNQIWLRQVPAEQLGALHRVDFATDLSQLREESGEIRAQLREGSRVWLTYVGLFETRDDIHLMVWIDEHGDALGKGFGHLGGAPAQILVKTAKDVVIEHLKKSTP